MRAHIEGPKYTIKLNVNFCELLVFFSVKIDQNESQWEIAILFTNLVITTGYQCMCKFLYIPGFFRILGYRILCHNDIVTSIEICFISQQILCIHQQLITECFIGWHGSILMRYAQNSSSMHLAKLRLIHIHCMKIQTKMHITH